jgi:hypothetical protein
MDFEGLVRELAAEFKRRGVDTHVRLLRDYWRVWWHTPPEPDAWTANEVVTWIWAFQLMPGQPHVATGAATT